LVILLIYTNIRYKKYKKALLEEIKHTDADGNPVKTTELDKIYKFSKPIKNAKPTNRQIKTYAPPPKVKSPAPSIRVQPIPLPVQPKPTFIIRQTPVPAPVPYEPAIPPPIAVEGPNDELPPADIPVLTRSCPPLPGPPTVTDVAVLTGMLAL
jgi:hypothetical protein